VSEARIALSILENYPGYAYALDLELRYLYLSKLVRRLLYNGATMSELVGRTGRELLGSDAPGLDEMEEHSRRVITTRRPSQIYETLFGRAFFAMRWPLLDSRERMYGVGGIGIDITSIVEERVRGDEDADLMVEMVRNSQAISSGLAKLLMIKDRDEASRRPPT